MRTLAARAATAAVLALLAAAALAARAADPASLLWEALLLLAVATGGVEWARLAGLAGAWAYVYALAALGAALWLAHSGAVGPDAINALLWAGLDGRAGGGAWLAGAGEMAGLAWFAVALWGALMLGLAGLVPSARLDRALFAACGLWLLPMAAYSLLRMPQAWAWATLLLVAAADTAAYAAGRTVGRRPLAPRISPGKTREGLAAALAVGLAVGAAFGLWRGAGLAAIAVAALGGALVALWAAAGDLTLSLHKRRAGVKDSGAALPGHGGVLDRIDGLLAAAPLALLLAVGVEAG